MCKEDQVIGMDAPSLSSFKQDLNEMIQRTLGKMKLKNADEAVITAKFSISLDELKIPAGPTFENVTKPSFKHDINSVIQVKDKMTGQYQGNSKLVYDDDEGVWVQMDIGDDQTSLFDDGNKVYDADYEVVEEETVETDPVVSDKPTFPVSEPKALSAPEDPEPEDESGDMEYDPPEDEE